MAITQDEVRVRIGVDNSGVQPGLKSASKQFKAWGAENAQQFSQQSSLMGFAFENSFRKTFKALKGLIALNLIGLAGNITEYWSTYTSALANALYNNKVLETIGKGLERQRLELRKAVAERDAAQKAQIEKEGAFVAMIQEEHRITEDMAKINQDMIEAKFGKNSDKALKNRKDHAQTNLSILEMEEQSLKNQGKELEADKKGMEVMKARLELLNAENAIRDQAAAKRLQEVKAQNAINATRREQLSGIIATGQFSPQLERISKLQQDLELSWKAGNFSRASVDQNIIRGIQQSMAQQISSQMQTVTTPQDKVVNALLDLWAPIKSEGGMPVTVTNTD